VNATFDAARLFPVNWISISTKNSRLSLSEACWHPRVQSISPL
jgi:hypothetical protein